MITVRRSGGTAGTVMVDYDVAGGTATGGGVDYSFSSGTLVFGPGVVSKTFAVNIVNDTADEGSETVNLVLQNATPATALKAPTAAVLTITDNEPVFVFSAAKYTVSEAVAKSIITVKRTGVLTAPATVDYSITDGTATLGLDYNATTSGSLTFGPGIATRTFEVDPINDTVDEPNETVLLTLVRHGADLPIGTPGAAVLTITDNDVAGKAQFSVASFSVDAASGLATVTVKRSGGTSSGATVACTLGALGDTAVAGTDYTNGGPLTVTFGLGQTTQTFTIPVFPTGGANKFLTLTLGSPGGNLGLGTPASAQLWIVE